ncbi:NADP-dependent oxidoreductase [Rhodococcus jostii]|uniref:NADP-dependent oxidoreductase n=1 Tax=Rhodococcus jostii TaxID=132919 RepID=UPI0036652873
MTTVDHICSIHRTKDISGDGMHAIRYDTFGAPEVLHLVELPDLTPGAGQLLVKVNAAAVNSIDAQLRAGLFPPKGTPPFILGLDVSGSVEEVGVGVSEFKVGDEVIGYLSPDQGGYASHVVASSSSFVLKPANLSFAEAAALPLVSLTAWQALEFAGVTAGQRVLIHAAAGGVGHVAVQLAARRGAEVIATARSVNHDYLRSLGATTVIDHQTADFAAEVAGIDVVFDLVGRDYGARSLNTLRPGGLLVGLTLNPGMTEAEAAEHDAKFSFFGLHASQEDLSQLVAEAGAGRLTASVERTLPLADAADAHELLEAKRVRGKIVLVP